MKRVILALAALSAHQATAQVVLGEPSEHLDLEQISEGSEAPRPTSTDLIGGRVISRDEFPGVFYTRQGNSRCTGTLIGARVVATAAHCVSNGATLSLSYQGRSYSGRCTHHVAYKNNSTADWALCLLTEAISDPIAESINTDGSRLKVGANLVLMGYGCINPGGSGGNDGQLRQGAAPITSLPSGTNYDIVTRGNSALCYGDSGGPSFYVDAATGARFQTGINSRGNISTTSYLSAMHAKTNLDFYKYFATQNNVKICGIHDDATSCRAGSAEPLPEVCQDARTHLATLDLCTSASTPPALEACVEAIDAVQSCVNARAATP